MKALYVSEMALMIFRRKAKEQAQLEDQLEDQLEQARRHSASTLRTSIEKADAAKDHLDKGGSLDDPIMKEALASMAEANQALAAFTKLLEQQS